MISKAIYIECDSLGRRFVTTGRCKESGSAGRRGRVPPTRVTEHVRVMLVNVSQRHWQRSVRGWPKDKIESTPKCQEHEDGGHSERNFQAAAHREDTQLRHLQAFRLFEVILLLRKSLAVVARSRPTQRFTGSPPHANTCYDTLPDCYGPCQEGEGRSQTSGSVPISPPTYQVYSLMRQGGAVGHMAILSRSKIGIRVLTCGSSGRQAATPPT
jgi:hypothetical protein